MWKSDDEEEFTLGLDFSKSPLELSNVPSMSSDTKLENGDLDGEKIDGKYGSSDTKTSYEDTGTVAKEEKRYAPNIFICLHEMKTWAWINRETIAILGFLTLCLVIGIGIPLSLVYRTQKVVSRPIIYQRNSSIPGTELQINIPLILGTLIRYLISYHLKVYISDIF